MSNPKAINVNLSLDREARMLARGILANLELIAKDAEEKDIFYDDFTLTKVYAPLLKRMSREEATDVVNELQNAGILFRERRF